MDFEEEFIKREQSDDLLFEAYDEPVKSKAIKLAKQALEINPISIMYYKKGDYRKCKKVLKEIQENNEYLLDYLIGRKKFSKAKIEDIEINGTYSWGSEAEAYFVARDYEYLLKTVPTFTEFIEREF